MKIYFVIFFLLVGLESFSQGYTKGNFFLTVDDHLINDTIHTLILSKDEVFVLKKLRTNFSWAHIKSFVVYFSALNSSDAISVRCKGNLICDEVKKMYQYIMKNSTLFFVATVENNQGKEVEWGTFSIVVK